MLFPSLLTSRSLASVGWCTRLVHALLPRTLVHALLPAYESLSARLTLPMGRIGLERMRFGVYLLVPIVAVVLYSLPFVHETSLKSSSYVVYPPNPGTELRARFAATPASKGGALPAPGDQPAPAKGAALGSSKLS